MTASSSSFLPPKIVLVLTLGACGGDESSNISTETETAATFSNATETSTTSDGTTTSMTSTSTTSTTTGQADVSSGSETTGTDGGAASSSTGPSGCLDPATDEPNDEPDQAGDLGSLLDSDDTQVMSSRLEGADDVDWWTYACTDTLAGSVVPQRIITGSHGMRVCKFMDCAEGGNPLFECPSGTQSEMAPFDFLPGCCTQTGDTFDLGDFNCPDGDENIIVYMRVDQAVEDVCVDYSIEYGC